MSNQEEQEALNSLRRMDKNRLKLALIILSNMAKNIPLPKSVEPISLKLVSNADR